MSAPTKKKRWPAWGKKKRTEAVRLLVVWFFEMQIDFRDGDYECTCCEGDPCPLHRVSKFLRREAGVRGLPRIPSAEPKVKHE